MKTDEVLNLDYRKQENRIKIQRVLSKLKPLAKYADELDFEGNELIPLEAIERTICGIARKYDIRPQFISTSFVEAKGTIYGCGVMRDSKSEWLGTVYGMCIYELLAKLAIKMASEVKSGKIARRTASANETERRKRLEASNA